MATDAQMRHGRLLRIRRAQSLHSVVTLVQTHPVWAIFLLAALIRVAVCVGIAILQPHNIAPDGVQYSHLAADVAIGHTAGWDSYDHTLYHDVLAFLAPIAGLYEVFGTHPLVGQLYVALLGAGTAALTTRLAMEVLPTRWALAVGLIVALLPTQIIWSSLILKDTSVWFVLTGLALTIAVAGRSSGARLLALGVIAAVLLVLLGYLRFQTLVIASWALMLAALLGPRLQRVPRICGAIALGVLIPWLVFNLGPAGLTYAKNAPAPSRIRLGMAQNANTPIPGVEPPKTVRARPASPSRATHPSPTTAQSTPATTARTRPASPSGATHPSPTTASGATHPSPTTAQSTPATAPTPPDEVSADLRHLPQGVLAMLVQPYPWQSGGTGYLNAARGDAVIWYPLLLLALLGLLAVRPRHLRAVAFPLIAGGAILIFYALTEGNVGTAFRHRGEFEWVIALLAGFGLLRLAVWRSRRRGADSSIERTRVS